MSPSFQGKGYGRMLMAHAEKLAASSNFEQVKLYTNKLFVENVQLYIRLGYSVDREGAVVSGIKGTSLRVTHRAWPDPRE
ncbi:MAG TPA: GNAT family N-acetyltransferase [Bradyrhizobium sp.]|nr:GNAT family N-acetyltransferase [Bradyrhizobium sp.]